MFSGIVEELGQIRQIRKLSNITLLCLRAEKASQDVKIGDSICVNGVCLSVVRKENIFLTFEVIPESFKTTNLGSLRVADKVNLERSLKIGDRISGHFVTGHVDCMGIIRQKKYLSSNLCFDIITPGEYLKYILPKGSVCVDGISLTVADKKPSGFSIYIIPHTFKNTTLGFKGPSDKVNIEFDILAKRT